MIQITTTQFTNSKDAEIDHHIYHVRRLGAGEALDISQIFDKMQSLRSIFESKDDSDEKTSDNLTKKQSKALSEFSELLAKIEDIYAGLFDDGGDGSKSKALIRKVGIENVSKIIEQIFGAE